jgi:crossover junction endodeoxyribonuclease RuvC
MTAPLPPITRVLGIDTSLRCSGVGVVVKQGNRYTAASYGAIRIAATASISECLNRLRTGLVDIIKTDSPEAVSIEGAFFFQNAHTALVLGQARGVAIQTCVEFGLPVYEYAPRRVKQAVVGYGAASKTQVQSMMKTLLNLPTLPQSDAADALALALCHFHSATGYAKDMLTPI